MTCFYIDCDNLATSSYGSYQYSHSFVECETPERVLQRLDSKQDLESCALPRVHGAFKDKSVAFPLFQRLMLHIALLSQFVRRHSNDLPRCTFNEKG